MRKIYFIVFLLISVFSSSVMAEKMEPIVTVSGTAKAYSHNGRFHYLNGNYMARQRYTNYATEVVFGDDESVFLKNPFAYYPTNSYIKGQLKDGVATFDFPQIVEYTEVGEHAVIRYAYCMRYDPKIEDPEAKPTFVIDESKKSLKFFYEDGVFTMESRASEDDPLYAICLCDENGNWLDNAEDEIKLSPVDIDLKPLTPPSQLETEEWIMSYKQVYHDSGDLSFELGFDGTDCWVKGFAQSMPDVWVKGKITNSFAGEKTIQFPTDQYLGISKATGKDTFTFFVAAFKYYYDESFFDIYKEDYIEFKYNEKEGTLSVDEDAVYSINPGSQSVQFVETYTNMTFSKKKPGAVDSIEATEIVKSTYYDMYGHEIANPENGVYVKVDRMSNGSVKASKIVY